MEMCLLDAQFMADMKATRCTSFRAAPKKSSSGKTMSASRKDKVCDLSWSYFVQHHARDEADGSMMRSSEQHQQCLTTLKYGLR